MSRNRKEMVKRLQESLSRFPAGSDMHAEIARQLALIGHPVFAALSDSAVETIASNGTHPRGESEYHVGGRESGE